MLARRLRLESLEDRRLLAVVALDPPDGGPAFAVEPSGQGAQRTFSQCPAPSVAANADGDFIVVWAEENQGDYDVYARRLDGLDSNAILVNSTTQSAQKYAGVALDDQGDFVVTWSSLSQDGSGYGVYARRFDAAGEPKADEFRVNTRTSENQNLSAVAMDADGDFVITWTSQNQDGSGTGVFAQRYDSSGDVVADEFQVNNTWDGNQRYSSAGMDAAGNFVVTWTSQDQDGSGENIYARRYSADGIAITDEFLVNTDDAPDSTDNTAGTQQLSSVAVADGGRFVVVWQGFQDATWKVYARRFDADGIALGGQIEVGRGRHPSVTAGPDADFVVAWESDLVPAAPTNILAQHYDRMGNPLEEPLRPHDVPDVDQTGPSVAMTADRAILFWTSETSESKVYARLCEVTGSNLPTVAPIDDRMVSEGETVSLTATATNAPGSSGPLTFSLDAGAPNGATIASTTGELTWTPGEEHGPGTYLMSVRATDDGTPPLSGLTSFQVTVDEVNEAPVIDPIDLQVIDEEAAFSLVVTATDPDLPANVLRFELGPNAPAGAFIDPTTGEFTWIPDESQGPETYNVTVTVTDDGTPALSHSVSFSIIVDEVNRAPVIEEIDDQEIKQGRTLRLTATATDPDFPANALVFSLDADAPQQAAINPTTGLFVWTPAPDQLPGAYDVTVRVTDDGTPPLHDTAVFSVLVKPEMLCCIDEQTVDEGELLWLMATATDAYDPPDGLTFSLDDDAPEGASIVATGDSAGQVNWTPTEEQGPETYTITVLLTDDDRPELDDSESFSVTVNEVNRAPTIAEIADQTTDEETQLSLTVTATDDDVPANGLTFALGPDAPEGAAIDAATGEFTWTPNESQGPRTHNVTVTVTDDGTPACSHETSFSVTVDEVNQAPVIEPIGSQLADLETPFSLTVNATDADLPANELAFELEPGFPGGADIDSEGVFTWTPTEGQGLGTYDVTVRVTDDDETLALSDAMSFSIVVETAMLEGISDLTVDEGELVTFTAAATDPYLPADGLTFSLDDDAPNGASIVATGDSAGEIKWQTTEEHGPGTYTFTVRLTDDDTGLSDGEPFSITVNEINQAPVIEQIDNRTIDLGETLSVAVVATDSDLPADELTFSFADNPPAGATIDPATGEFTWTPTEQQGLGAYDITVQVTDGDDTSALSDTVFFSITVEPPMLDPIFDFTVDEQQTLTFAATATDPYDLADGLTFSLDDDLPGGDLPEIDPETGEFTWTPSEEQGPGTYTITVRLTDGDSALSDSESFSITVNEVNRAPVIAPVADRTIPEKMAFSLPVTVTDLDLPPNQLDVRLDLRAPDGATIDPATGRFNWTPSEEQGPGTYTIAIWATDDGTPVISDLTFFSIVVAEINQPPEFLPIDDQTVDRGATLIVNIVAADADLPANGFAFSLDGNEPSGAAINSQTGQFTWTPMTEQDLGIHDVTVWVTDDGTPQQSSEVSFRITVEPPMLEPIADFTVDEGQTLSFTAAATDPYDPADGLTFSPRRRRAGRSDHQFGHGAIHLYALRMARSRNLPRYRQADRQRYAGAKRRRILLDHRHRNKPGPGHRAHRRPDGRQRGHVFADRHRRRSRRSTRRALLHSRSGRARGGRNRPNDRGVYLDADRGADARHLRRDGPRVRRRPAGVERYGDVLGYRYRRGTRCGGSHGPSGLLQQLRLRRQRRNGRRARRQRHCRRQAGPLAGRDGRLRQLHQLQPGHQRHHGRYCLFAGHPGGCRFQARGRQRQRSDGLDTGGDRAGSRRAAGRRRCGIARGRRPRNDHLAR